MSLSENFGTSYGASILHVSPEAFVGGTLAFIQTGDQISVDVPERKLDLLVSPEELERRRQQWTPPERKFERGYGWMFAQHILQADKGCDFDYLETSFGRSPGEPVIY
ncbi:dihydroxy-acid dehydratase [Cupriavidus necator]|uniref:dihydroxy-acid dehydratase domain-containing protein n=1 Tax=Cupriavidus necator TaxID=106590 RepID=UPI0039C37674